MDRRKERTEGISFVCPFLGGVVLAGFDKLAAFTGFNRKRSDSFEGGQLLGLLDFVGESPAPLNSVIGAGLDARLYSDLSAL